MPTPDFNRSRRILRRARIGDALGFKRRTDIKLQRDRLLELLLADASRDLRFGELQEDRVDIVVSLALAEVTEPTEDSLLVIFLCIKVLAADGQFARIRQLVKRLRYFADRLEVARPFLSLTVKALAVAVDGDRPSALQLLASRLGLTGRRRLHPVEARSETLQDILCAAALHRWMQDDDTSLLERGRDLILRAGNGLLLGVLDAMLEYAKASHAADVSAVLAASDVTFTRPELADYVAQLPIQTLFPAQIEALRAGVTLDDDRVVALPTSSGKTLLAQLRIAATLARNPGTKAIYVAPYRLLAHQVERDLTLGLRPLGYVARDVGSGFDPFLPEGSNAEHADILICTPEKLDALMRHAATSRPDAFPLQKFFSQTSLLIFDELHLIGRSGRGPRFELLITRIRGRYPDWRILGLCAATQGADALSRWLTSHEPLTQGRRPTGTIEIAWQAEGRLRQRVGAAAASVGELARTGKALDDAATLVLTMREELRPVLVIAISRPNAEGIARRLAERDPAQGRRWREQLLTDQRHLVDSLVQEIRILLGDSHKLADYLSVGIAYHHAGVPDHLLRQIENLAQRQILRALCSTTTVAEGSDLPFRAVVIPHLNFPGRSGKLERDLYYNIIGRAGRANVAMEGMVFILESSARTLHDLVPRSLWANTQADRVASQLSDVTSRPTTIEDWEIFTDVQGQVLAWIAEAGAGAENQAEMLANSTLGGSAGDRYERTQTTSLIRESLRSLEDAGMARAASPFRVTALGELSRLGGLAAISTRRLSDAIRQQSDGWIVELVDRKHLNFDQCRLLAALLFESVEVLQQSVWLRRTSSDEGTRWEVLRELISGRRAWPESEEDFRTDVSLLANWVAGTNYADLAALAPSYPRANSLFGGTDITKRTSDAAEYIGRIAYPAVWTWSAIRMMLGPLGENMPHFIRHAIETGTPSESASMLVSRGGVTRPTALLIQDRIGSAWEDVARWIADSDDDDIASLGITLVDVGRIRRMTPAVAPHESS